MKGDMPHPLGIIGDHLSRGDKVRGRIPRPLSWRYICVSSQTDASVIRLVFGYRLLFLERHCSGSRGQNGNGHSACGINDQGVEMMALLLGGVRCLSAEEPTGVITATIRAKGV